MSLTDLLKDAEQRKQALEALEEQEKLAKTAELESRLAIERAEFETMLKKDAGDIFDRLDEPPTIGVYFKGQSVLQAKVFHRVVVVSRFGNRWNVVDRLIEAYQERRGARFPDKTFDVDCDKLSDYLLVRFLEIAEERDRLLAVIEEEKVEKERKARLEARKRETENRLRLFSEELHSLVAEYGKKMTTLVETRSEGSWAWPNDFVLDLYKVSWCTGAYRGEYYEQAEFDYDSGWSLNDVLVGEPEWFVLLPERGRPARTVKTSGVVTVERFRFTKETLPDCLFDRPQKIDIEVVEVKFTVNYSQHRFRLLPELIPPLPEGCRDISINKQVVPMELRALPIVEIQQAINKLSTIPANCIEVDADPPF